MRLDAMKAQELAKAAEEEKMDRSAEEKQKDAELKQLHRTFADSSSSCTEKERKPPEETDTLRSKLSTMYSFLECGLKKKVVVEDTDEVIMRRRRWRPKK